MELSRNGVLKKIGVHADNRNSQGQLDGMGMCLDTRSNFMSRNAKRASS